MGEEAWVEWDGDGEVGGVGAVGVGVGGLGGGGEDMGFIDEVRKGSFLCSWVLLPFMHRSVIEGAEVSSDKYVTLEINLTAALTYSVGMINCNGSVTAKEKANVGIPARYTNR
jgi:hypothetical protein